MGESSFLDEGNIHRESTLALYSRITFRTEGGRIKVRTAAFVFGSQITTSGPLVPACLLIRSSPVVRFRSFHCRAAISPSRVDPQFSGCQVQVIPL